MKRRRNLEAHQLEAIGKFAELSIKTAFLVNGGSCIALLAFLGNLTSVNYNFHQSFFLIAGLAVFALGVLFASYASGATYRAQIFFFLSESKTDECEEVKLASRFTFWSYNMYLLGCIFIGVFISIIG